MTDFREIIVSSPGLSEFSKILKNVRKTLPQDVGKQLGDIIINYISRFGVDGMYERMNGRTIGQIISEYKHEDPKVVASGEVGGLRYRLVTVHPGGNILGQG